MQEKNFIFLFISKNPKKRQIYRFFMTFTLFLKYYIMKK